MTKQIHKECVRCKEKFRDELRCPFCKSAHTKVLRIEILYEQKELGDFNG